MFFLFYFVPHMYFVYVLKWKDKHYIWYTNDLQRRLAEHRRWWCETTKQVKDLTLLWYFKKETESEAQKLEKIIKRDWHIQHRLQHPTFIQYSSLVSG
jgi:predicted GIY-YIG superfamily endonuclease